MSIEDSAKHLWWNVLWEQIAVNSLLLFLRKSSIADVWQGSKWVKIYRQNQIFWGPWANAMLKTEYRTFVFPGGFPLFFLSFTIQLFWIICFIYWLVNLFTSNLFIVVNFKLSYLWSMFRPYMNARRIILKLTLETPEKCKHWYLESLNMNENFKVYTCEPTLII